MAKIKSILLNNHRAFYLYSDEETERYRINLPNGSNLLIYGENGSGKSSLFKGLKDFFISAGNRMYPFQKNMFCKEEEYSIPPAISIILDDDNEYFFSLDRGRNNHHENEIINAANITKGFISYRDLLKLHFHPDRNKPDLFSFFLGSDGLLAEKPVSIPMNPENRISYKELWEKILQNKNQEDLADYNLNVLNEFRQLSQKANLIVAHFFDSLQLSISYTEGEIINDELRFPEITITINLFEKEFDFTHEILNEARLTALALSVYLAYILSLPATDLQILF